MNNDDERSAVVVAMFAFQGDPALSQLSFPHGAIIHVVSRHSDWWYGSWNGTRGWFPPSHCRLTGGEPTEHQNMASVVEEQGEPVMGGAGEIHGAVRNFATSPTFNPGLEDELAAPKREYEGYEKPFENHPQTDFEKAVQAKHANKRKIFRGIKIGAPAGFHIAAAKHEKQSKDVRPAIRITSSPSGSARTVEAPRSSSSGYQDNAAVVTPRHPQVLPPIPPTTKEQMALEQRALMEQQTVLRQQELLERQQQQIQKLELENQRFKTKWWKRAAIKKAE